MKLSKKFDVITSDEVIPVYDSREGLQDYELWAAVLLRGIIDYKDPNYKDRAEIRRWAEGTPKDLGSYAWLVELLGLDAYKDKLLESGIEVKFRAL